MCSVLIFVKTDNTHDDPSQDWKKFKAGDVIDINEKDKFDWGAAIQGPDALGWWRVVTVPGAQTADLAVLLSADPMPYGIVNPDPTMIPHRKRIHALKVAGLQDTMTAGELLALATLKPAMSNPSVIG